MSARGWVIAGIVMTLLGFGVYVYGTYMIESPLEHAATVVGLMGGGTVLAAALICFCIGGWLGHNQEPPRVTAKSGGRFDWVKLLWVSFGAGLFAVVLWTFPVDDVWSLQLLTPIAFVLASMEAGHAVLKRTSADRQRQAIGELLAGAVPLAIVIVSARAPSAETAPSGSILHAMMIKTVRITVSRS